LKALQPLSKKQKAYPLTCFASARSLLSFIRKCRDSTVPPPPPLLPCTYYKPPLCLWRAVKMDYIDLPYSLPFFPLFLLSVLEKLWKHGRFELLCVFRIWHYEQLLVICSVIRRGCTRRVGLIKI
jgi:hypothetical protein